jgi:hypothetical protein
VLFDGLVQRLDDLGVPEGQPFLISPAADRLTAASPPAGVGASALGHGVICAHRPGMYRIVCAPGVPSA